MMYSYYAFRAMKYRIPKWMQISITICQLLQMAVGCFVNYQAYTYKQQDHACDVTYSNIGWSFAMYAVYFGLFLHFFCLAYFPKKKAIVKVVNGTIEEQKTVHKESTIDFLSQIIPMGLLIVSLVYNMLYPVSSILKYMTWPIYTVILVFYVRSRSNAKENSSSSPFSFLSRKKSQ